MVNSRILTAERFFFPFSIYFFVLSLVAYFTSSGDQRLTLDFIDSFKIFGIDDAYRFYSAKAAFSDLDLYVWGYMQPVVVFSDGLIIKLVQGSLFGARCFHALIACSCLFLIFRAMLSLQVKRWVAVWGLLILALMPAFVFVSLSFLSEFWLFVLLTILMFFFVQEKYQASALVASLLPLVRPEGLICMLPVAVFFVLRKSYLRAFVCFVPGCIYLVFLFFSLDDFSDYYRWVSEVRWIIQYIDYPVFYNAFGAFSSFNFFWVLLSMSALLLDPVRKLWPVWLGVMVVWLVRVFLISKNGSFYEVRYFFPALPVLMLSYCCFFSRIERFFSKKPALIIAAAFSAYVAVYNLSQLDPVRYQLGWNRWPVKAPPPGLGSFSRKVGSEEIHNIKKALEKIYDLASMKPVDYLVVGDYKVFYFLDPERLPSTVKVAYTPVKPERAFLAFSGTFFAMHPGREQYGYFKYFAPRESGINHGLLAVHPPFCDRCDPVYKSRTIDVYLFNYLKGLDFGA